MLQEISILTPNCSQQLSLGCIMNRLICMSESLQWSVHDNTKKLDSHISYVMLIASCNLSRCQKFDDSNVMS